MMTQGSRAQTRIGWMRGALGKTGGIGEGDKEDRKAGRGLKQIFPSRKSQLVL